MALERFQEATVHAAVNALTRNNGVRRFLVADEVGLGKTVTAKAIASELQKKRSAPLNIVYMCPNLDIASQNLTKFQALDKAFASRQDRLSLVLLEKPLRDRDDRFLIYCYTPETSLPGWRPGQRTGRYAERELIAKLLKVNTPTTWSAVASTDRERERFALRRWFPGQVGAAPNHLIRPFEQAFRHVMDLVGKPLDYGVSAWLESGGINGDNLERKSDCIAELILRGRAALALASLQDPLTRPDLLILDEFHKYADILFADNLPGADAVARERHRVQKLLADCLIGEAPDTPALLLLSATPYRLQRLDHLDLPGGRYEHFVKLVKFLYGNVGRGNVRKIQDAINTHHSALLQRNDPGMALKAVKEAKSDLEKLLRPIIARTERATAISGQLFDRRDLNSQIESRDLVTFRHLAHAVDGKAPALRSWVPPLWSSVPYPAETLFNYAICKALGGNLPQVTIAAEKGNPAHPQLRALIAADGIKDAIVSGDRLSLPWLAPTKPWWPLSGRWGDDDRLHGKTLIFSRYRGTPAAVSLWLSQEVDRRSSRQQGGKSKFAAQAYLRPDKDSPWPLIALFFPWPTLSLALDPKQAGACSITELRRLARLELRAWLEKKGLNVVRSRLQPRKPWRLALDLEGLIGPTDLLNKAVGDLAKGYKWRRSAPATISPGEITLLADWLVEAPGLIVARTLHRHEPELFSSADGLRRIARFCWHRLRPYLGQRYFAGTILGKRKRRQAGGYPEALRRALVEGGFEATLDEHVAVMSLIGDKTPIAVLEESLVGRPGRVQRRTTRALQRARVHAAVPYLGAEPSTARGAEKLRSEALRKGFNSPFWPHVLVTTSIGQEGLDFHVWCDRVVHWDLPRDPVDFEQREGRISRYGSLCVRRALSKDYADAPVSRWQSPFGAIFAAARADREGGLGLERWWSPLQYTPMSVSFSAPFSLSSLKLKRLREDLVRYRLALGQPDPQLFEEMVDYLKLASGEARNLALNLSPAVSNSELE